MKQYGSGNEVRVGNYARRKGVSSKSFETQYVPCKVLTIRTKERLKSALNEYLVEYIWGSEKALENIKLVLMAMKEKNWKTMDFTSDKTKIENNTIKIYLKIREHKLSIEIGINGNLNAKISDENFNPGKYKILMDLYNLWCIMQMYND